MNKVFPATYKEGVGWLIESSFNLTSLQMNATKAYIKKVWEEKRKDFHLSVDTRRKISMALKDLDAGKVYQVAKNDNEGNLFQSTERMHPERSFSFERR